MMVNSIVDFEYDNSIGLMYYIYGDGIFGFGVLLVFEGIFFYDLGGNLLCFMLCENFCIFGDFIYLDVEGYVYKVRNQVDNFFFNEFWGNLDVIFYFEGGSNDGWVDVIGNVFGIFGICMGDDGFLFSGFFNDW